MNEEEYLLKNGWTKRGHWWIDPTKKDLPFVHKREYQGRAVAIQTARDEIAGKKAQG